MVLLTKPGSKGRGSLLLQSTGLQQQCSQQVGKTAHATGLCTITKIFSWIPVPVALPRRQLTARSVPNTSTAGTGCLHGACTAIQVACKAYTTEQKTA